MTPAELEQLIKAPGSALAPEALERARAAAAGELARTPQAVPWTREAGRWLGAMWLLWGGAAVAGVVAGVVTPEGLVSRLPSLALVSAAQVLCAFAASAPRGYRLRWPAVGLSLLSVVGVVVLRAAPASAPTAPAWACTVSHLAVDALPLWLGLRMLRGIAPASWRFIAAGLAVGATGGAIGELACGRGWEHVALYHVTAWLLVAAVALWVGSRRPPLSYAP